ncbi:Mg2+ transporter protein, CorA-like/Zinc transport protein ZntB [Ophiocordyceps camponoti-floridani]|uniref:Mg2+ transporter protein, CorA-like/Zinc transport protein ZntB n=1 Tax=Ophiocordyceps camponoti-floridani TaxID=2030778 RepID=A0A8H4Q6V4_9HYPO|nr:Mg2+ transporter protein, CorA-like/Zinc transport protein ZntB [Ophiocordyceps camponoti-floridani]
MLLSHNFTTSLTTGFIKGTPSSDIPAALHHMLQCGSQHSPTTAHGLLLPTIMLSLDLSPAHDQKQREARDWLRHLENAVSLRDEVEAHERYAPDGLLEIDGLSRDLVECHGHVMWKRPQAYRALVGEMEVAMGRFRDEVERRGCGCHGHGVDDDDLASRQLSHHKDLLRLHASITARLEFYRVKLTGLENYVHTTLARLKVQREALYNIMSQREARLNLEIAGEQRRIAHASKRDSTAMKTISLMGAVFLPGTYLASVFSTSFFDFKPTSSRVASDLWIYFIVTIPLTAAIVGSWWWWDRRREAQFARDDEDLEKNIDKMEKDIMFHLRKRTMSKAHTWNTISAPPRP